MAAGSRGSRKVAGGNRLRTALACVGAVACVAASASGDPAFDATAAPTHQTQPASTGSATPAGRQATPAMFVRAPAMPTLGNVGPFAAELGVLSADAAPSWVDEAAPQGARGGEHAARRLSAEVLKGTAPSGISSSALGIPGVVLTAYHRAADEMARQDPSCGVSWWLLAGIGRIESGHASGGRVDANGTTLGRILGPRLDGSMAGNAVIHDSDGGAFDGDPHFDRAVGPMQFLPGTWASVRSDGNGDGVSNPNNVYDATLGAARYLCLGGADLRTPGGLTSAVLRYNNSMDYVRSVLTWGQAYRDGEVAPVKSATGRVPAAVNPRQLPVEPPRSHSTKNAPKKSTPKKSAASPDKSRSDSPTRRTNSQDKPPVLADGPRQQPDRKGQSSSGSTPRPSSTVPPTKSGATKGGSSSRKGSSGSSNDRSDRSNGGSSTAPSSNKPTTPPSSTTPPPDKTDPTSPGKTDSAPSRATWVSSTAISGDIDVRSGELKTPAGIYTVSVTRVSEGKTVQQGNKQFVAAAGEQFWIATIVTSDATRVPATLQQFTAGKPKFSADVSGTTSIVISLPKESSPEDPVLTVDTGYSHQTVNVSTDVKTLTWTQTTATPKALLDATPSPEAAPEYAKSGAKITSLSAIAAPHLTPWDPARGLAGDGKVWLVVPYSLGAEIAPEGFDASTWLTPAVTVGDETIDPAVLQPLAMGQQSLAFPVSETASGEVTIAPRVQVKAKSDDPDGTIATFAPMTFSIQSSTN